ncbi:MULTISPECIES: 16S rRNA (uracil(1498)-N(3))-methyltransferase [unclassified Granulicatella]|uniref:16S rRNA (uracil(1498)-N(3))-methyltransferase n=1 Tax=unclassified Granulicatella TaxID=2630493 RepID=UPI001073C787|nr:MULTISPECIES: 16S rRNA (uracil(1498)-N(3))-methyltransferase [unclassified Granulicatella]MBF0779495.1 16S rRNA (uracil(1498)-N(3))-methyltransferase [Granulicatella sp. 19428wC4_WM01]TFU96461.1 16S rRNA (uracil(1498)-N(3))-methyltransferase [Granulicatella sp. WM01]
MQRYFLQDMLDKQCIVFEDEHYHHIVRVMRMKVGDRVYVVLPDESTVVVELSEITESCVRTKWIEDVLISSEMPIQVTVALGIPKGDKLDWVVQKTTELGAFAIQPFESDWSVVKWDFKKKEKKKERLQKIAREAAEQSHRSHVPIVHDVLSFQKLLHTFSQYTHVLVAYEESAKTQEKQQFRQIISTLNPKDKVLIIFGSEGGLSDSEIKQLVDKQAILCGLGPRIMRAETAPMYVLAACSYELELR